MIKRISAALAAGFLLWLSAPGWAPVAQAASSRAVVIVDTGAEIRRITVSFASESISGLDALQLAGASPKTVGFGGTGAAVCELFGVGNPATSSSCLGTSSDPRYWAYHRSVSGTAGFVYWGAGAGATQVRNGDVEGWRFGLGEAPPYSSFCDVAGCGGAASSSSSGGSSATGGADSSGAGANSGGSGGAGGAAGEGQGGTSSGGAPGSGEDSAAADGSTGGAGGPEAESVSSAGTDTAVSGYLPDQDRPPGSGGSPSWRESGTRSRSFPISLAILAMILTLMAAGVIWKRRKTSGIGKSHTGLEA